MGIRQTCDGAESIRPAFIAGKSGFQAFRRERDGFGCHRVCHVDPLHHMPGIKGRGSAKTAAGSCAGQREPDAATDQTAAAGAREKSDAPPRQGDAGP